MMIWVLAAVAGIYVLSMLYFAREVQLSDIEWEDWHMKYRTRPAEVEAMQWPDEKACKGKEFSEFFDWLWQHADEDDVVIRDPVLIVCEESGAWVAVKPGMYVIRQAVRGRFTAMERWNFEYAHEPSEEPT